MNAIGRACGEWRQAWNVPFILFATELSENDNSIAKGERECGENRNGSAQKLPSREDFFLKDIDEMGRVLRILRHVLNAAFVEPAPSRCIANIASVGGRRTVIGGQERKFFPVPIA